MGAKASYAEEQSGTQRAHRGLVGPADGSTYHKNYNNPRSGGQPNVKDSAIPKPRWDQHGYPHKLSECHLGISLGKEKNEVPAPALAGWSGGSPGFFLPACGRCKAVAMVSTPG